MTDLITDIELYESDMSRLAAVGRKISEMQGTWGEPEAVAATIAGRYLDAGYVVEVMLGVTEQAGVNLYSFSLRLTGRTDPEGEYDHERQAYEVRKAAGVPLEGISENEAWKNVSVGRRGA